MRLNLVHHALEILVGKFDFTCAKEQVLVVGFS